MPRDPVRTLLRLREIEVWQAQTRLSQALEQLETAEAVAELNKQAMRLEVHKNQPGLSAWLPRAFSNGIAASDKICRAKALSNSIKMEVMACNRLKEAHQNLLELRKSRRFLLKKRNQTRI